MYAYIYLYIYMCIYTYMYMVRTVALCRKTNACVREMQKVSSITKKCIRTKTYLSAAVCCSVLQCVAVCCSVLQIY